MQSGKPVGVMRTHEWAPRVLIANSNLVGDWANWEEFRRLEHLGLTMYGQMTAGSWIYIGTQGILQGTYETFAAVARQARSAGTARPGHDHADRRARRHGRRAAARGHHERRRRDLHRVRPEPDRPADRAPLPRRAGRRPSTDAVELAVEARDARQAAVHRRARQRRRDGARAAGAGRADRHRHRPDLGARPAVLPARRRRLRGLGGAAREGPGRPHRAGARVDGHARRRRWSASRTPAPRSSTTATRSATRPARAATPARSTSPASCRPTSGRCSARARARSAGRRCPATRPTSPPPTGRSSSCSPTTSGCASGSRWPASGCTFQGLPARICWLGYGERHLAGLKFNEMVASGELKAPVVIGRDHLDCGSVASPYRETEAMLDGSDAIADWPLLNALVNTASGATWVSIHHGGGVGMGRSIHAGQVTVADGTDLAAQKIERVLTNDPGMGVIRHVDAGYDEAVAGGRRAWRPHPDAGGLIRAVVQAQEPARRCGRAGTRGGQRRRHQRRRGSARLRGCDAASAARARRPRARSRQASTSPSTSRVGVTTGGPPVQLTPGVDDPGVEVRHHAAYAVGGRLAVEGARRARRPPCAARSPRGAMPVICSRSMSCFTHQSGSCLSGRSQRLARRRAGRRTRRAPWPAAPAGRPIGSGCAPARRPPNGRCGRPARPRAEASLAACSARPPSSASLTPGRCRWVPATYHGRYRRGPRTPREVRRAGQTAATSAVTAHTVHTVRYPDNGACPRPCRRRDEPVVASAMANTLEAIAPPIVLVVLVIPVTNPVRSGGCRRGGGCRQRGHQRARPDAGDGHVHQRVDRRAVERQEQRVAERRRAGTRRPSPRACRAARATTGISSAPATSATT